MDIFGPSKPIEPPHIGWRALVAGFLFLFGGIIFLALISGKSTAVVSEVQSLVSTIPLDALEAQLRPKTVGGDVVVEPPLPPPPQRPEFVGDAFNTANIGAQAVMVKDVKTGMVLLDYHGYEPRPMASITKLMSTLVVLEKLPQWASTTTVVSDDIIDTHMYAGDTYTLDELWNASLVGSSNKAILTLADAVGWPRAAFVERMNQRAREIGMSQTIFADQTGLDVENVSTASDLLILLNEALLQRKISDALMKQEVNLYSKERKKAHHMWNTNWLLLGWIPHTWSDQTILGKTGYIPESGYNFLMRVSDQAGHELDVVVLGAATHEARFTQARDAALWAYENYEW